MQVDDAPEPGTEDHDLNMMYLLPDDVHFFFTMIEEAGDPDLLARCRLVISEEEKAKADRYLFEKDRRICVVTRALLRFVLSACTGREPESFEFCENAHGKPALKQALVRMPVEFNLSHSGGAAACALTLGRDIGVDIENLERAVDLKVAERFFTRDEAAYVRKMPPESRPAAFFDLWTLKESYIKARGTGLSIGLDQFGFQIDRGISVRFEPSLNDSPDAWTFFRFSPVRNYRAAVAVRAPAGTACRLRVFQCIPFIEIREIRI